MAQLVGCHPANKGHQFDPWLEHMPGLCVWSPILGQLGHTWEATI